MTEYKTLQANFLEIYLEEISPQLETLDITLKSMDEPITMYEAATALYISLDELKDIMSKLYISEIDRSAMLKMMMEASSPVCRMYQRELACGSPRIYTSENISYIYDLPLDAVNKACDVSGLHSLTNFTLPELFCHIHI